MMLQCAVGEDDDDDWNGMENRWVSYLLIHVLHIHMICRQTFFFWSSIGNNIHIHNCLWWIIEMLKYIQLQMKHQICETDVHTYANKYAENETHVIIHTLKYNTDENECYLEHLQIPCCTLIQPLEFSSSHRQHPYILINWPKPFNSIETRHFCNWQ